MTSKRWLVELGNLTIASGAVAQAFVEEVTLLEKKLAAAETEIDSLRARLKEHAERGVLCDDCVCDVVFEIIDSTDEHLVGFGCQVHAPMKVMASKGELRLRAPGP